MVREFRKGYVLYSSKYSNDQFCRDKIHAAQKISNPKKLPCLITNTGQHDVTLFQNLFHFVICNICEGIVLEIIYFKFYRGHTVVFF